MNSLLISPGLPGGMMGSLMADLENNLISINKWMKKNGKKEVSQDELLIDLFDEVQEIWPKMGYPPLVTPFSQYVKNVALINVMQMKKGKKRWSIIDDNTWDMMLGKAGKLPGTLSKEIIDLANEQGREFFNGRPQDLYPNDLDSFRSEMEKNGWDTGEDDEELMELAMHPQQYRNYKSGKAKEDFEADIVARKMEKETVPKAPVSDAPVEYKPKTFNIDVNGEQFKVMVSYDMNESDVAANAAPETFNAPIESTENSQEITAPIEGNFYRTKSPSDKPINIGDTIQKGEVVAYIESMKVYNAITSEVSGKVIEICFSDGSVVEEDDSLIKVV
jgi:pyruvate carboxylase subunit B